MSAVPPRGYSADYPARHRRRQFVALLSGVLRGALDLGGEQELEWLCARRRRGVRRGRRLLQRRVRALIRYQARCNGIADILTKGNL